MPTTIYTADAFTNRPYSGNPAAVCPLTGPADEAWMQAVAREMNLSETAFLWPLADGWSLRWLTPTVEVDLCGHATLASAHVLWQHGYAHRGSTLRFHTRSGLLTADEHDGWITLNFPNEAPHEVAPIPALTEALGVTPRWVGRNRMDVIALLDDAATVRTLAPDMAILATIETRGVIVTAQGDQDGVDFVSRFFGPNAGVDEDPVTGSAHCGLAPYWGAILNKSEMVGLQCSARSGFVKTTLVGDRVLLSGQAVTVLKGELLN
jgi:PhzF family phenazine biosynthesis protein